MVFSPPCKWELKLNETSKGKRKSRWHNSSAAEEDKLKVMHYNIFVCGVLIRKASIIDSVILGPWMKCKLFLYSLDTVTSRKFVVRVRAKSSFCIGDWVSFRAGLQQDLEETVSLC